MLHNKEASNPSCEFQNETEWSKTARPLGFHFPHQAILITQIPVYI